MRTESVQPTSRGHRGTVRSLALTPDGRFALTAGNSEPDRSVKLWNLVDGELLHSFEDQAAGGEQTALALSADGRRAATSFGPELRLWDAVSRAKLADWPIKLSNAPLTDIAFAGDRHLLVGSDAPALVELATGRIEPLETGSGPILRVAASPRGDLLAVLQEDLLAIWTRIGSTTELRERLTEISPLQGDYFHFQPPPLRFAPDGSLFFGSAQSQWTPEAGVVRSETRRLANVADYDAAGAALQATSPGSFQVIDTNGDSVTPELQCGGREISCLAISGDGSTVLAADYDHHLWVWWLGSRPGSQPPEKVAAPGIAL